MNDSSLVPQSSDRALSVAQPAKPPYGKYALNNPYNLILVAAALTAAIATGNFILIPFVIAFEALWLALAPRLGKTWFDRKWAKEQAGIRHRQQTAKFNQLPYPEQVRALKLRDLQRRIQQFIRENPSLSARLLRNEIDQLEDLVDDFLELALLGGHYENYLQHYPLTELETERRLYESQLEKLPLGDERRSVAQKNLDILLHRRDRFQKMMRHLQTLRGQMDLMENTFLLLADEVVISRNMDSISRRLEEIHTGVEMVRQTTQETERLLQTEAGKARHAQSYVSERLP